MGIVHGNLLYMQEIVRGVRQRHDPILALFHRIEKRNVHTEHSVDDCVPRLCRVLLSFEPACAGGSLPSNAALAQAYRVVTVKLRTLVLGIGSKRKGSIANTAGYDSYTILHGTRKENN